MKLERAQKPKAISVVEVLIVIGIIGLFLGLLLPAVQRARDSAARTACSNNLRQIGMASHNYHNSMGTLPPAYQFMNLGELAPALPWPLLLLPYMDQQNLWMQSLAAYDEAITIDNPPHVGLATVIPSYACPSDGRLVEPITDDEGYTAAYRSYQGIGGATNLREGAMQAKIGVRLTDISDGTSQTLFIGERPPPGRLLAGSWYALYTTAEWVGDNYSQGGRLPYMSVVGSGVIGRCNGPFVFGPGQIQNPCDCNHFWSLHPGGANFLFADASARFLPYSAAPLMPALATCAGGEAVEAP
jgi:prepilin-type processing-associated H-X9-DG protein